MYLSELHEKPIKRSSEYREGPNSTATHNGKEYKLDVLFKLTQDRSPVDIKVNKLNWVLQHSDIDFDRLVRADTNIPILVYDDPDYGLTVIDGAHRLAKAIIRNLTSLPAIVLSRSDMDRALV